MYRNTSGESEPEAIKDMVFPKEIHQTLIMKIEV